MNLQQQNKTSWLFHIAEGERERFLEVSLNCVKCILVSEVQSITKCLHVTHSFSLCAIGFCVLLHISKWLQMELWSQYSYELFMNEFKNVLSHLGCAFVFSC